MRKVRGKEQEKKGKSSRSIYEENGGGKLGESKGISKMKSKKKSELIIRGK